MIFDFVIIPVNNTFIDEAYYIRDKLEEIYYISYAVIDTNYNTTISSRIHNLQNNKYNIITINEDYNETNTVDVMFVHTNYKLKTMPLKEFLNLVVSYKNENEIETEDDDTFKCYIM
jgi:threonyl-tRNA synthetase